MKVWGHPRSGNHFLASLIHSAFYASAERFSLRVSSGATGHWSQRRSGVREAFGSVSVDELTVPWGRLLGSHVGEPPAVLQEAIYVYRDGRDVALSVYSWDRLRAAEDLSLDLAEYLRLPIDWTGSPGVQAPRRLLLWEHWRQHVEYWLARQDVLAVRYEDLIEDLDGQLRRISAQFGQPLVAPVDSDVAVGWNASNSNYRLGRWRGRLSEADIALFDELVPRDFAGRWDSL